MNGRPSLNSCSMRRVEVQATMESMNEEDIRRIMRGRYTMVGSDAWAVAPTGVLSHGKPHPRYYGTYPRNSGEVCPGGTGSDVGGCDPQNDFFPRSEDGHF